MKYSLPILVYDHKCTLCQRFGLSLDRLPGTDKITKVSIHDKEIFEQFPKLDKEQCDEQIHLIIEDGTILQGPEVLQSLIERFPGTSKFAWLLDNEMGKKAITYFYGMAQKYRESLLNRCDDCKKR